MSELPTNKPDISEYNWGDGGSPETQTAPGSALRSSGYPENSEVAHEHINWRFNLEQQIAEWVVGKTRIFDSLADLAKALDTDEIGRIREDLQRPWAEGSQQELESGSALIDWCTDGKKIYTAEGDMVKAYTFSDLGTSSWDETPDSGEYIGKICCDGQYVFATVSNASGADIYRYDASDGGNVASINVSGSDIGECKALVTDGQYIYGAWEDRIFCEYIPTWSGVVFEYADSSGDDILAMAISCGRLFVATDNHRVHAYEDGSIGSAIWRTNDTGNSGGTFALAADEKRVYAFGSLQDSGHELEDYLVALSWENGDPMWSTDDPSAANEGYHLSVDGQYLYLSNDWATKVYEKHTGNLIAGPFSDRQFPLANGIRLFVNEEDGGGADYSKYVREIYVFNADPVFRKVEATDEMRPIAGWVVAPTRSA